MGHATHFLRRLERVSTPQADLALTLYRDREQVAHILMAANIAHGAQRVALALEREPDGPHVIVTRTGAFVTCLAAGMSVNECPIISRADIDHYRRQLGQVRQATEEGTLNDTLSRVIEQGPNVSREDLRLLIALYPLLSQTLLETTVEYGRYIDKYRKDFRPARYRRFTDAHRQSLRAYWKIVWCVGHLTVLHGAHIDTIIGRLAPVIEGGLDGILHLLSACTSITLSPPIILRGVWAMACAGARALPFHRQRFESTLSLVPFVHATCTIAALGLRHPELRGETRAILERCASPLVQKDDGLELRKSLRDFVRYCAANLTEEIEGRQAHYRKVASTNISELARKSFPKKHIMRFERPEDVPDDLIYTLPVNMGEDALVADNLMGMMTLVLPWLATADAEQLYLPERYFPAYVLPWSAKKTIAQLDNQRRFFGHHAPVRAQGKVGRNEPCPCGSGKKHKRCCGA